MEEPLRLEAEALAAELEDRNEASLLIALLDLVSRVDRIEPADDDYTPFVYPH